MGTNYTHVTWRERLKIGTRLKDGWGPRKIADELGRHVSTIYCEKKRGLGIQRTTDLIDYECYIPEIAQAKYEEKFSNKGSHPKIGKDHEYANHLGEALKDGECSPQAALGEMEAQGLKFETKNRYGRFTAILTWVLSPAFQTKTSPLSEAGTKRRKRASHGPPGTARGKA